MDKNNACDVIDREISLLFDRPINAASVDLLFKLTNIRSNIANGYNGKIRASDTQRNGNPDRDINTLFENYARARKGKVKCEITSELQALLCEISYLVTEIYNTATCEEERKIITDSIKRMELH